MAHKRGAEAMEAPKKAGNAAAPLQQPASGAQCMAILQFVYLFCVCILCGDTFPFTLPPHG